MEDAVHSRQRPKLEKYPDHLFVVFQQLDEEEGQLEAAQIACFIGERWIFALHAGAERTLAEARRRWDEGGMDVTDGALSLLHTLLDVVVDDYQDVADRLERTTEDLEEIALSTFNAPIQRQVYQVKQQLARLRRYALPAARVLDPLLRDVDMVSEVATSRTTATSPTISPASRNRSGSSTIWSRRSSISFEVNRPMR